MREDIELYNESNAWALWARGLGGRTRAEAAADLAAVAAEHTFVGMKLAQDDELVVRLVVGDLEPDEEAGWTARITRRLDLPSGRLVLSGGFEPRGGAPDGDEFCRVREVPAGSYRVDIHTWVGEVEDDPEALLGFVVQLRPFDGDPIPTAAPWADWLEGRRQPPAPSSDLWPDRRSPAAPIPPDMLLRPRGPSPTRSSAGWTPGSSWRTGGSSTSCTGDGAGDGSGPTPTWSTQAFTAAASGTSPPPWPPSTPGPPARG